MIVFCIHEYPVAAFELVGDYAVFYVCCLAGFGQKMIESKQFSCLIFECFSKMKSSCLWLAQSCLFLTRHVSGLYKYTVKTVQILNLQGWLRVLYRLLKRFWV